ncbi:hypothetical protein CERSUDRAFT_89661 [Gelatoporia subvermispora B]|uniref:Uncharacterized protein n=1 Tax=Ceriporiopsis subvermispora (strain B) TaxID=914234 RepID=M2Q1Y5_CERS8|nr:hypothetical protein CERSUDRAFT_89661 [Gelatoporia subvermispora B]
MVQMDGPDESCSRSAPTREVLGAPPQIPRRLDSTQRVPLLAQGLVVREPAAQNAAVGVSSRSEHVRGFIRPLRDVFALESSAAPAPAQRLPTGTSRLADEHYPRRSRHRAAGFTTPVVFRRALPLH